MRKFTRAYFRQAALAGASAMTPEQRRGRAKAAAQARWAKAQLPTGNDNVATNAPNRATESGTETVADRATNTPNRATDTTSKETKQ